ncbi:PTS lactose/cellobiose family IIC subunit [Orenia metallireducens]|uniref:Permease IIC component n=1 Tax=Orenia metallireducens TaxID=1413210 RepID=A0A1C0A6V2_9FIRM|nr:PTS transporter subunit EIIC [Orenia metallireducens]OCL25979.1 PTS lactose/cellobiose family IIC subunit [Orenia metallireducens]
MNFDKLFSCLQNYLVPFMIKTSNQRHIQAIKKGLVSTIPVTFIGSIVIILRYAPIKFNIAGSNSFFKFLLLWREWSEANNEAIMKLFKVTVGIYSVFLVLAISYNLAREYKLKEIIVTKVAIINFLIVSVEFDDNLFIIDNLNGQNLFTAIIVAILTVEIMRKLDNIEVKLNLKINIPPATIEVFTSLVPLLCSILFFYFLDFGTHRIIGISFPEIINIIFDSIVRIVDTPIGIFFFGMLMQLLWFTGIHGVTMVDAFLRPILEYNWMVNLNLYLAGQEMDKIFTIQFLNFYMLIGGAGTTLAYSFLCWSSSAQQLKKIGETNLISSLFNIDESLIFASPLVLNKILFIPFVFVQPIIGVLAYLIISYGIVQKSFIRVPWIIPAPLGALLSTLDWKAAILVIFLTLLSGGFYYPFFKKYENHLINKGQG